MGFFMRADLIRPLLFHETGKRTKQREVPLRQRSDLCVAWELTLFNLIGNTELHQGLETTMNILDCARKPRSLGVAAKDGGWAWVVCAMSSLLLFLVNGFSLTIGLLYTYLLEEFGETRAKTALVASILHSASFLSSPLCCIIIKRFGVRRSMALATVVLTTSFLGSSVVTKLEVLYVTLGLLYGIGACLLVNLVFTGLFQHFEKRASLATAIVSASVSLGPILFTKPFKVLLELYGWRFLLRVLSIPLFLILVIGVVVISRGRDGCICPSQSNSLKQCYRVLHVPAFRVWIVAIFFARLGGDILPIHQTQFTIEFGISWEKASMLPLYMGIGNTIGRLALGQILHWKLLRAITSYQVMMVLGGITGLVSALSSTYTHLVAFCILYMVFDGSIQGLDSVPVMTVAGGELFAEAFGIQLLVQGVSRLIGPPVLGLLVDKFGDYTLLFYSVSLPLFLGALTLCIMRCIKSGPYSVEKHPSVESKVDKSDLCSISEWEGFLTERITSV